METCFEVDKSFYDIGSADDLKELWESDLDPKWLTELESVRKETWRVSKTFKLGTKKPRVIFKRLYHCHFNVKQGKKNESGRKRTSRNIDCQAKLSVTIKRYIPDTKSKSNDIYMPKWPCVVEFRDEHNHNLNSAAALRERPVALDVKNRIIELFEKGHSVSSAYHSYILSMMEEHGDNYENIVIDRHFIPTKTDIESIWKSHFKKNYGERTGESMLFHLDNMLRSLLEKNGTLFKIIRKQEHYAVALCTPIMQRVATLNQSSEIMFVDSTGNCDTQNHKVYYFITQSAIGGLPLGCILSSSQESNVFVEAVSALYEIFPIKIKPKVILTDDDLAERNALKRIWPDSCFLLCTFHVLKACWKWLKTGKNKIPSNDVQSCYKYFRNIVVSKSYEDLEKSCLEFIKNCKYDNFTKYVKNMMEKADTWCLLYRQHLPLRGTDTNNYIEVIFRLLKDIPLERTKAFNLPQLCDFITTNFESYYKQRILDILLKRVSKTVISRYLPDEKDVADEDIIQLNDFEYEVKSQSDRNLTYFVDLLIFKCTCPQGFTGKHCKHQAAVVKKFNIHSVFNTLSLIVKCHLYQIATGKQADEQLFSPIQDISMERKTDENFIADPVFSQNLKCAVNTETNKDNIDDLVMYQDHEIKEKWKQHSERIMLHLERAPSTFYPAIQTYLSNCDKYANSEQTLLSGLHTAFKYKGVVCKKKRPQASRKRGKHISVQPTSIGRRKTAMGGKKAMCSGRKPYQFKSTVGKAPHSLTTCVKNNVGLGGNKSKK